MEDSTLIILFGLALIIWVAYLDFDDDE